MPCRCLILPCPKAGQQSRTTTGPLRRAHLTWSYAQDLLDGGLGLHNGESILFSRMWLSHRNTPCAEYPLPICALGNLSQPSPPGALATGSVRETYGAVNFLLLRIMQVKPLLGSRGPGGPIAAGARRGLAAAG